MLAALAVLAVKTQPPVGLVPLIAPEGRSFWLAGLAVCLLGALIFQVVDRLPELARATALQRGVRYDPVPEWPTAWILPFVTLASGTLLLCAYHSLIVALAVTLFGFISLVIGQFARLALYSAEERIRSLGRLVHTLLLYGVGFVSYAMIYVHKLRSLYSATAIFLLAVLLLLQLTEGADVQLDRRVLYAMTGALVLAEATWVLNYWPATGWLGGAVLLAVFHVLAGLTLARVERALSWRTIAEYGIMASLAIIVIVWGTIRTRGGP
jgi:hypothetical protein